MTNATLDNKFRTALKTIAEIVSELDKDVVISVYSASEGPWGSITVMGDTLDDEPDDYMNLIAHSDNKDVSLEYIPLERRLSTFSYDSAVKRFKEDSVDA